jgi:hypothetical protein
MAQPVAFTRNYDFTDYQADFPNTPLPAAPLDANLDAIAASTGQIVGAIAQIQRDDGALKNQIVTFDSLSNDVRALLGSDLNPRGAWVTATVYAKLDMVSVNGITYIAVTDHTSGTFATDLAANKWILFSNPVASSGSSFFQQFSGDGSTTVFTLSSSLGTDENALLIFYNDGAASKFQPLKPTAFTVNGTSLTISPAPVLGTNNIYVFSPSNLLGAISASQAACAASESAAATSATNSSNSATDSANSAAASAASATAAAKRTIVTVTGSKTFALTDADKYQRYTGGGSHTWTVPASGTADFADGDEIDGFNATANNLTLTAASSVTVNGVTAGSVTVPPYSGFSLKNISGNTWDYSGFAADSWA